MSTLTEEELLTVAEAASLLRINQATLYRWLSERRLRSIRLGSGPCARLRIARSELERFLDEASTSAAHSVE